MKDEKHLLADIEGLKKSPWFNASYISDERRLGIREALDMISSIIRKRGGEMDGEKVAKQLEKDVAAYRAGFADGYRVAKAEEIHCEDCIYYDPPHVENKGKRYEYKDMPEEAFDSLGTRLVSGKYGINVGGRCCRDYQRGYMEDKRVFVRPENYCGRAEREEE